MKKNYSSYEKIELLQKGVQVKCDHCNKGYYTTTVDPKFLSICKEFNCNYCGSRLSVSPNVIVD